MSRAFVRESDDPKESIAPLWQPLSPGIRNFITPSGAKVIQEKLASLLSQKQAADAAGLSDAERLKLDAQIRQFQQRLQTLVITPAPSSHDRIAFGATVSVRNQGGEQATYRIVGIDETDLERDWISWQSPLARALVGHKRGDRITFRAPAGTQELEILGITFE